MGRTCRAGTPSIATVPANLMRSPGLAAVRLSVAGVTADAATAVTGIGAATNESKSQACVDDRPCDATKHLELILMAHLRPAIRTLPQHRQFRDPDGAANAGRSFTIRSSAAERGEFSGRWRRGRDFGVLATCDTAGRRQGRLPRIIPTRIPMSRASSSTGRAADF